ARPNGVVEKPHFDIRQVLYKAADGVQNKWLQVAHFAFWSERVSICKRMGCLPYFAVTGCHPILPFDISEATYLMPPPKSLVSTTKRIARHAIALQK
ncbi:uncharacterized protein TRAVEDRAFT_105715, partial [Trametes versicolor FP-101664 SS1]|uniref:uncharacterized protein n=1 Tax=Trametes versicolor (strain FP-101664) TaxID=717944 RepID=UPI00046213D7